MGVQFIDITENKIIETDFISGCCIICKPSGFNKLSGFDEQFFLYYEDVDFCIRAKKKGYNLFVMPDLHIYHRVGSSTGGDNSKLVAFYSSRNRIYLMRKHFSGLILIRFYLFFIINRSSKILSACLFRKFTIDHGMQVV